VGVTDEMRTKFESAVGMLKEERYETGHCLATHNGREDASIDAPHIKSRHGIRAHRRPGSRRGQPEQGAAIGSKTAYRYNELGMVQRRKGHFAKARTKL